MGILEWAKKRNEDLLRIKNHTRETPTFEPFGLGKANASQTPDRVPVRQPIQPTTPLVPPRTTGDRFSFNNRPKQPPAPTRSTQTRQIQNKKPLSGLQRKKPRTTLSQIAQTQPQTPSDYTPMTGEGIGRELDAVAYQNRVNRSQGSNIMGPQQIAPGISVLSRGTMINGMSTADHNNYDPASRAQMIPKILEAQKREALERGDLSKRPVFENIRGMETSYSNQASPLTMYGTKDEAQRQEYSDYTQKKTLEDMAYKREMEKQGLVNAGNLAEQGLRNKASNYSADQSLKAAKIRGTSGTGNGPNDYTVFKDKYAAGQAAQKSFESSDDYQLMDPAQKAAEVKKRVKAAEFRWDAGRNNFDELTDPETNLTYFWDRKTNKYFNEYGHIMKVGQ